MSNNTESDQQLPLAQQAKQLVDMACRAFRRQRPLFVLVQYNHAVDKQQFITAIQSGLAAHEITTHSYDPLNNAEQGASKLYPLLQADAQQGQCLSLVVSLPQQGDNDKLSGDFLNYLNLYRDRITHQQLHWILFIHQRHMAQFMAAASDLWSFRHRTFRLERQLTSSLDKLIQDNQPWVEAAPAIANEDIAAHLLSVKTLIAATKQPQAQGRLWLDLSQWLRRRQAHQLAIEVIVAGLAAVEHLATDGQDDEQDKAQDQQLRIELASEAATVYRLNKNKNQAQHHYQQALALAEQWFGPEDMMVAKVVSDFGDFYREVGDNSQALALYQRALIINEQARGADHPAVAGILINLAGLYRDMGDDSQALACYHGALDVDEKTLGPQHPKVATTLNHLANLRRNIGDYRQALPLYQRALSIKENAFGLDHPEVAASLNNLANLNSNMGEYQQALALYQRALVIKENTFGLVHPKVAVTLNNLALLYKHMGDYSQALPLYQRALVIRENTFGPDHPKVATTLNDLALLYKKIGDYSQASILYQRALAILQSRLGDDHSRTKTVQRNYTKLQQAMANQTTDKP